MAAVAGRRHHVGCLRGRVPVSELFPRPVRRGHDQSRPSCRAMRRLRARGETREAANFGDAVFSWQMVAQLVILVAALGLMPWLVRILAPGFADNAGQMALTAHLARITFPYLILSVVAVQLSAMLNALEKFAAAAAWPALLNCRDDHRAAVRGLVSQRRRSRGLGRSGRRDAAAGLHPLGGQARRAGSAHRLAALDARDQGIPSSPSARSPSVRPASCWRR